MDKTASGDSIVAIVEGNLFRMNQASVRAAEQAAESNSASARSSPFHAPSNASMPKGATL
jgi:hypothetical protein